MEDMRALVNSLRAGRSYERVEPYEDVYWTPTLLAAKLHVAQKTIWRWIRERRLRDIVWDVCFESRIPHCRSFWSVARRCRALVLARESPTEDFARAAAPLSSAHTIGSHGSACLSCSLGI